MAKKKNKIEEIPIGKCDMCGKKCKGDCCSKKCAKDWVEKYINIDRL